MFGKKVQAVRKEVYISFLLLDYFIQDLCFSCFDYSFKADKSKHCVKKGLHQNNYKLLIGILQVGGREERLCCYYCYM